MKNSFSRYLPVTQTEISWGAYLTAAGRAASSGQKAGRRVAWVEGRIRGDYYLVFFCAAEPERSAENTCFFLLPNDKDSHLGQGFADRSVCWLGFNGVYAMLWMAQFALPPGGACIKFGNDKGVAETLDQILSQVRSPTAGYQQQVAGLLLCLLGYLYQAGNNKHDR